MLPKLVKITKWRFIKVLIIINEGHNFSEWSKIIVPSTEALLGRIVMAPSATFSCWCTGEIFEPQLSEPTQRKWFVWLLRLAASRTRLKSRQHRTNVCYSLNNFHFFLKTHLDSNKNTQEMHLLHHWSNILY